MRVEEIKYLFNRLNDALAQEGELGEICLVGGALMCLVYQCRDATKDVDAIFEPATVIRKLAARIGREEGVGKDWLNDAVKGFIVPGFKRESVLSLSHLRIWAPEPKYILAMKCLSARWDTSDKDDVIFLIKFLKLKQASQVFQIIQNFYPKQQIPPKTQFFIEEYFEALN